MKYALLNGFPDEKLYIEQLDGYSATRKDNHVYLLKKVLYGPKQALKAWYERMNKQLVQLGFCKSQSETTLYAKANEAQFFIVSIYVDDMFIIGNNSEQIQMFKYEMKKVFEMIDLGLMKYFLGMEVMQSHSGIFIF